MSGARPLPQPLAIQVGGASVAENQYYVNGFNVTNSFRSLNYSAIPFEAIAEQQTKTGGYGAEFGRSLGGVGSSSGAAGASSGSDGCWRTSG